MRSWTAAVIISGVLVLGAPQPVRADTAPEPATLFEWISQEHTFLRHYLVLVRQIGHDFSYEYKTPPVLMPVTVDIFTNCVAHLHAAESQFLYPNIRPRMSADERKFLWLIEHDQESELNTMRAWQHELEEQQAGRRKMRDVATTIDYLARMLNRHIVLQEQHVVPVVNQMTPEEQAAILKDLLAFERQALGPAGRAPFEQLIASMEWEIKVLGVRIW